MQWQYWNAQTLIGVGSLVVFVGVIAIVAGASLAEVVWRGIFDDRHR